ncbi:MULTISPECIES: hypothetical protein [unclassified Halomonas]|nr:MULTISPECIES: hypothetical protein [unclassified Halomonas]MBY5925157.1 hypothetical protein [Halomonas sp. DP4Y7-2]MBY6232198.1 hypothetical protein [Halomonas sp. DP4Y7-1]
MPKKAVQGHALASQQYQDVQRHSSQAHSQGHDGERPKFRDGHSHEKE